MLTLHTASIPVGDEAEFIEIQEKGDVRKLKKEVDFGEHDLLCLRDDRMGDIMFVFKIFLQPSDFCAWKHTTTYIFTFYFCINHFQC